MADVATIGGIIGALIGVIGLLLRLLVVTKNQQIDELKAELARAIAERDLFRDLTLSQRHSRD